MSRRVALAAFGAAGVAAVIGAAPAVAHPQQSERHTVAWATPADPTGPMPVDWSSAGHPQQLLSADGSLPDCLPKATWAQIDQYTVPMSDAADYAAFIAGGVLGEVNGGPADSRWVQSWRFVLVPRCVEATSTPSATPTTVAPSETPTTDAPTPADTPAASDTSPGPEAPSPASGTGDAPTLTASELEVTAATPTEVAATPAADEQLAYTGVDTVILSLIVVVGMLALGALFLLLGRRPGGHR